MKRVFLVMVVSALLVTLGFAQTPAAGSNTDPVTVKGCLGGSDGNYTVAEDGSRQIFKITTSSVDLKPHVGHDVKLTGHKASGAVSSGAADNSFAITELSMISEHCATAAAPITTIIPPSETVITPAPDAAAAGAPAPASAPAGDAAAPVSPPAATASAPAVPAVTVSPSSPTVTTPAVDTAAPAVTVSPSSATVSTPPVEAAAPAATASQTSATVTPPVVEPARPARASAHARKPLKSQAVAAATPDTTVGSAPDTGSPAAADAATSTVPASPTSDSATAPAAATPVPAVTHRAGSLTLLIAFVVLVVVLGTLAPLIGRWRKRKMLERTGSPNLSFTNEVSNKEAISDLDKPEPRKVA